jgi:hypothetical protein
VTGGLEITRALVVSPGSEIDIRVEHVEDGDDEDSIAGDLGGPEKEEPEEDGHAAVGLDYVVRKGLRAHASAIFPASAVLSLARAAGCRRCQRQRRPIIPSRPWRTFGEELGRLSIPSSSLPFSRILPWPFVRIQPDGLSLFHPASLTCMMHDHSLTTANSRNLFETRDTLQEPNSNARRCFSFTSPLVTPIYTVH